MPVFQAIAQGTRDLVDFYNRSPKFRALANTVGIYAGIKLVGDALGLKSSELEAVCDLAAPVVSGAFAGSQINDNTVLRNPVLRDAARIAVSTVVGADLAGTLNGYEGNLGVVNAVKQAYQSADSLLAEKLDYFRGRPTEMTGGLLGAGIAMAQRIGYHYNRLPRRRRR